MDELSRCVFGAEQVWMNILAGVGEMMSDLMKKRCSEALAQYRAATVRQLAFLLGVHGRTVSDQLQKMSQEGTVASQRYRISKKGRPAEVFRLTHLGAEMVRSNDAGGGDRWHVDGEPIRQLEHHMLMMSFRLHIVEMLREAPAFSVRSWHPGKIGDADATADSIGRMRGYEPDGAYSLKHCKTGKQLLFFLEADTGKESLEVIRGKVTNYIGGFRQKLAESWGRTWEAEFRGFRVLFVANNEKRLNGIVDVVREAEVDFIWTTTVHRLVEHGLAGRIWSRSRDNDRHSLLGSLAPADRWGHEKDAMSKACHIVRSADHA